MRRRFALQRPARLALLLAFGPVFGLGCSDRPAEPSPGPVGPRPAREAWNVRLTLSEQGRLRLRLNAPYLAAYEGDSTYAVLRGDTTGVPVTLSLFDANGDTTASVTAPEVVYREAERRFEASGPVVVIARGGRRLDAQRLVWNDALQRLDAPGPVTFASPTEHVTGRNLTANEDLTRYTLGQVTATVVVQQ